MSLSEKVEAILASGGTTQDILACVREHEQALEDARAAAALLPPWAEQVAACFERDGYVCTYCEDMEGPFQIDHVVPRSRGGTNALENLAVACRSCNASKKDRLLSEWGGRGFRRSRL